MRRYQHILVGLARDQHDEALIRYAGRIAYMAKASDVTFVHIVKGPVPDEDPFTGGMQIHRESLSQIHAELERTVWEHLDLRAQVDISVVVDEGAPLDELLEITRSRNADLLLVGQGRHDGSTAERLARKAPCSVIILPPGSPGTLARVMVPVDFSDHSQDAVEVAVAFAEAAGLQEVHLLHVYGRPSSVERRFEQSTYALRQRAEEAAAAFGKSIVFRGLQPVWLFELGDDVPQVISASVRKHKVDLLVIGTRGRSPGAAVLMGSVAESLVRHVQVPLIAVKQKGVTMKLLDALLERAYSRR